MDNIHLSEEEKYRVTLQVDHFIELISKRYGVEPDEVIDSIKWVRDQRDLHKRFHLGAMLSIVSVVVGGMLLALWEGLKHLVANDHPR